MKNLSLSAIALGLAVATAGCAGSLPQSGDSVSPQVRTASATSGDLLYVAHLEKKGTGYIGLLSVLTFPQGKAVATITLPGFATGTCADASGDVWVVVSNGFRDFNAFEYAHGGTTPIAKIPILHAGGVTTGCAVDPTTGNLAVLTGVYEGSGPAHIYIWPGARKGKPASYPINSSPTACAYDANGNLFIDGWVGSTVFFDLAELQKSSNSVEYLKVKLYSYPGGVKWDGEYLAVDSGTQIYRLRIAGSVAKIVAKVDLTHAYFTTPFDIADRLIVADRGYYGLDVSLWQYPGGGKATKTIARLQYPARGLTISVPGSNR